MGEHTVNALQDIHLEIESGDFVAIMGPSGSGKSTLLNMLGLLDAPTKGDYFLFGKNVSQMNEDSLSLLRLKTMGFVFQQFHLVRRLTAFENISLPLLYSKSKDLRKVQNLLKTFHLEDRTNHAPHELSGGQQQRVAMARALVNNPSIILADEPTGNLDSKSKEEVLQELFRLNEEGLTILMVTHEEEIGHRAKRLLRMKDGEIIADERKVSISKTKAPANLQISSKHFSPLDVLEYLKQGLRILMTNKIRSALSMIGIMIGVAAFMTMVAIGSGARKAIEKQLESLGSNILTLRSGGFSFRGVIQESGTVMRLKEEDAGALLQSIQSVEQVAPSVFGRAQVTYADKNWNAQILGTTPSYESMRAAKPVMGRFFSEAENKPRDLVAVLGSKIYKELFGDKNPIGEIIKINKTSARVIGVLSEQGGFGRFSRDEGVIVPLGTAMYRLVGRNEVDSIDLQVRTGVDTVEAETDILNLMKTRYRIPPSQEADAFQIMNLADIQNAASETSRTMSLLLASIAAIALIVGGIGIMNIMLVSVTERTKEIGLRKAIGASRTDILLQFLIEAVVLSVIGGIMGIVLGISAAFFVSQATTWPVSVGIGGGLLAFAFSSLIGIIFGLYPARNASKLHPVEALRFE